MSKINLDIASTCPLDAWQYTDRAIENYCGSFDATISIAVRCAIVDPSLCTAATDRIVEHIADRCSVIGAHLINRRLTINDEAVWLPDLRFAIELLVAECVERARGPVAFNPAEASRVVGAS